MNANKNASTCMVVYSYYPFDPRVRREVRALVAKGYEVDIICLRDEKEKGREKVDGAYVSRLPMTVVKGGYLRYALQYSLFLLLSSILLTRLFLRKRYMVIHVHSLPDFQVFAALVPKMFGSKVILDLHEAMPEIFAARFGKKMDSGSVRLAMFMEEVSCRFADRVITVNDTIREKVANRTSSRHKITVVMNSPEASGWTKRDSGYFAAGHRLAEKFPLVYVGGINEERNIEVLIEACAALRTKLPVYLMIFGYGRKDYIEKLRALTEDLDLREIVFFGGWIPHEDVLSYMDLARIGIVSYVDNPLTQVAVPNKVFEFAHLGKPLVIARLDALKRLFGKAALFYEPKNPDDLAQKVFKIHSDRELSSRLVSEMKKVYERCKWDVMKDRLYRVYDELRGRKV